jgi:hypothetical protein
MAWLDKVMDRLTRRHLKLTGSGHSPEESVPEPGAPGPEEGLFSDVEGPVPTTEEGVPGTARDPPEQPAPP